MSGAVGSPVGGTTIWTPCWRSSSAKRAGSRCSVDVTSIFIALHCSLLGRLRASERLADLPESTRRGGILGRGCRLLQAFVDEIAAADVDHLGRVREPHERFGAAPRAARKQVPDEHRRAHEPAVVLVERAGDEARVKTVGSHPRAL